MPKLTLFFAFLFLVLGLLAGFYNPLILLVSLLPLLFLFLRHRKKDIAIGLSFLLLGFLLAFFLPRGQEGDIDSLFLVVERKEGYCLVQGLSGRYLLYDRNGEYTLFSLVSIQGTTEPFGFSHFEQQFDFASYLRSKGVFRILQEKETEFLFRSPLDMGVVKSYAFAYLDPDSETIASSLLFGASLYDLKDYAALTELGLVSSMALGGFHLSFLLETVHRLLGRKNRKIADVIDLVVLVPFLFLSSFRFAVRRIFLSRLLFVVNRRLPKRLESLDVLSLAAILMLVLEPYCILSASFYYSFPFLFLLRLFPEKHNGKRSFLPFFVVMTLFFVPLRLSDTYALSLVGPLLQVAAIPLCHLIFLASLFLLLVPPIGVLAKVLVSFLLRMASFCHSWSPFLVSGKLSVLFLVVFYALLVLALLLRTYNMRRLFKRTLLASVLFHSTAFLPDFLPHHEIYFVDVDQGDCTLVRNGQGNFLIDTGGSIHDDLARECLVPFLRSKKIRKLDAVLITHYDWDHYGALDSLKSLFPIERVYDAEDFLKMPDQSITIAGIEVTNLNVHGTGSDANEQSGVYHFSLKGNDILVMGDAPKDVEVKILRDNPDLHADILRLGHHGSDTSSSEAFLSAVDPDIAILSVGENNSYGHPSPETIATLRKLGIPFRRTDLEGTIAYDFDAFSTIIETWTAFFSATSETRQ